MDFLALAKKRYACRKYLDRKVEPEKLAASLGLDTLWICMFKPEAVREEFGLPDTVEPVNILLIGYGADAPASPDRHATLRKPLEETVFYERFGQKR